MSRLYEIRTEQYIPATADVVWDFISSPHNLQHITRPDMQFDILSSQLPEKMYPGMIIRYRVCPVPGIRMQWVTEITHVQEGHYFTDEQRFGPFSFWHHQHRLKAVEGGTCMQDELHYKIPLGPLGDLAQLLFVRRQLKAIFDYRFRAIAAHFGAWQP